MMKNRKEAIATKSGVVETESLMMRSNDDAVENYELMPGLSRSDFMKLDDESAWLVFEAYNKRIKAEEEARLEKKVATDVAIRSRQAAVDTRLHAVLDRLIITFRALHSR